MLRRVLSRRRCPTLIHGEGCALSSFARGLASYPHIHKFAPPRATYPKLSIGSSLVIQALHFSEVRPRLFCERDGHVADSADALMASSRQACHDIVPSKVCLSTSNGSARICSEAANEN